jgi:uncharacterized protein YecT (DUF1311 family)
MSRISIPLTLILLFSDSASQPQQANSNVADADREYAAVFSHPAKPCPSATNTVSYNLCIQKEIDFTEQHLTAFLAAIRAIASQDDTAPPPNPVYGKRKEVEFLDSADAAWRNYRKNLCSLQAAGMAGGTGQASSEMDCFYRADREYVQQLADAIYLKILAK